MRDNTGEIIKVDDILKSVSTGQMATVTKIVDFREITFVLDSGEEFTLSQKEFYNYSSWRKEHKEIMTN